MKKTGQLLKSKREAAQLALSEVALATKINPKILASIENGEEANLPARTFLKGFIRSYALYLKLDPEDVMRLFHEETGSTPIEKSAVESVKEASQGSGTKRRMEEESGAGLRAAAVVVIALLIGLIIGIRQIIEKYSREKIVQAPVDIKVTPIVTSEATDKGDTENEASAENSPPLIVSATSSSVGQPAGKADIKAEIKVEVKPEAKPDLKVESKVAAKTDLAKPDLAKPEPVKVEPPKVERPKIEPPKVEVAKPEPPKPEPPKPEVKEVKEPASTEKPKLASQEIILEALDKVEIKFQIAGETKKLSLAPTQVHTIRADSGVVLDLSDGGAVNLIVNGREKGPAGDLGKPKQLKIP